jgi:quinol monooxygenase YgiN
MGKLVIAAFRPKPGKTDLLRAVLRDHFPTLRSQDLISDRAPIVMEASDGTMVEVFEWRSDEAVESAHSNPVVLALWKRFEEACDYVPISKVAGAEHPFTMFDPVET